MSRHPNMRRMARDDHQDDDDDAKFGTTPTSFSPSVAQYIYQRGNVSTTSLSSLMINQQQQQQQQQRGGASGASGSGGFVEDADDADLVEDVYEQIRCGGVVNVFDWARHEIDTAIREANYSADEAITALLDLKAMSGGQVTQIRSPAAAAASLAASSSKVHRDDAFDDDEYYDDDDEYYDDDGECACAK